jgi:hypothetical protein
VIEIDGGLLVLEFYNNLPKSDPHLGSILINCDPSSVFDRVGAASISNSSDQKENRADGAHNRTGNVDNKRYHMTMFKDS